MNSPFFCCSCDQDQSDNQKQSHAPPNIIQSYHQSHHYQQQDKNIQQSLTMAYPSKSVELKNSQRKDFTSQQRNQYLYNSQVSPYQTPLTNQITSVHIFLNQLKTQNQLHKISLTRKRSAYLRTYDHLTHRIQSLKTQYVRQESHMAHITLKVNNLLQSHYHSQQRDLKMSQTTHAPMSRYLIQ